MLSTVLAGPRWLLVAVAIGSCCADISRGQTRLELPNEARSARYSSLTPLVSDPAPSVLLNEDRRADAVSRLARSVRIEPSAETAITTGSTSLVGTYPAAPALEPSSAAPSSLTPSLGVLDARQVACQAAREWLPAKQLDQHAHTLRQLYRREDEPLRCAAEAAATFLETQARHQRDLAAATALRAYYSRAAACVELQRLDEAEQLLDRRLEQQSRLIAKGMAAPVDPTAFDREKIEIQSKRLQLQQSVAQLSRSIEKLTCEAFAWSSLRMESLEIRIEAIATEDLQQLALRCRRDLQATQHLQQRLNADSVEIMAPIISSLSGAALPLPKLGWLDRLLGRRRYPGLVNNLKEELELAVQTQTRSIQLSIADRASLLELSYRRLELAEKVVTSWRERFKQLTRLAELGDSRPAELTAAETAELQAQAVQRERQLAARLAEVDLAEATGGLCERCCHGQAWLVTSGSANPK